MSDFSLNLTVTKAIISECKLCGGDYECLEEFEFPSDEDIIIYVRCTGVCKSKTHFWAKLTVED